MKLHVGLLLVFLQGSNSGSIFGSPPKKVICSWLWWCSIAKINRISFYPSSQLGRPTRIFSQSFTIKKHPLGIFPHSFPIVFPGYFPILHLFREFLLPLMIPGTAPAYPTAPRVQEFLHGAEVLPILLADRWVQTGPQPLAAGAGRTVPNGWFGSLGSPQEKSRDMWEKPWNKWRLVAGKLLYQGVNGMRYDEIRRRRIRFFKTLPYQLKPVPVYTIVFFWLGWTMHAAWMIQWCNILIKVHSWGFIVWIIFSEHIVPHSIYRRFNLSWCFLIKMP